MAIIFHRETQEFHLYNKEISYVMAVLENGQLGQIYFGKKVHDCKSFREYIEYGRKDMAPCAFQGNREFSMEYLRQEYPSYGRGDMRYPAYEILQEDGSRISEFQYDSYEIYRGKKKLKGLPAVYTESDKEAETLEITLKDRVIGTTLILSYTIFEDMPVICRNARFEHQGKHEISLEQAMSLNVDFADADYEMVTLTGAWARERYIKIQQLHEGIQSIYSMRGHSSHQFNPFFALKRKNTTEDSGEVIGFSLVYSGNFLGQVNVDTFHVTRAMIGIHPEGFSWTLKKGETFQTPEAVLVYSEHGMNGMSQTFHRLYRTRLARGFWKAKERPVVINNWEATFMNFDEEKIMHIATTARDLGVEMFVLDDGWFGKRDDDTTSLGDWYPDFRKLPNGIKGIAEKIEQLGMKFGLWIEPEMVSKESNLYREHPDWLIGTENRPICHGRNQYVLDFSKEEVVDYIGDLLCNTLRDAPISYIKWDMNRSISEAFSRGRDRKEQGKLFHRHILGIYRLYERLTTEFPQILFESCASGGARFDPGMLYYAPQCWTSDNTDAVERIGIQYGTSMVYPLSSMGCHVSEAPNQQTFRNTPLQTRADVAYFGCFGYEMDLNTLTEEEKNQIKRQVEFYKSYRKLIMEGTFYRVLSPFELDEAGWEVVSEDRNTVLAAYYRMRQPSNAPYKRFYFKGLDENKCYRLKGNEDVYYGDELMHMGMVISDYASGVGRDTSHQGDYQSRLFILEAVQEEEL